MKRYRILHVDFDTRPGIFKMEIKDDWEESIKARWIANREKLQQEFVAEFGSWGHEVKLQNFLDLDAAPFSIIAFHGKFLRQIRTSFVVCAYYPALTSACALGERILNHLMLKLRDYFSATEQYKRVYRKNSFDNWDLAIDTLVEWGVLLSNVADNFRKLKEIRNDSIHFQPEVDTNDRELALSAIHVLQEIIYEQFGAGTGGYHQPWFIEGTKGAFFIKKSWEEKPFIKEVYLPHCVLVGPKYRMTFVKGVWGVDDIDYDDVEIEDEDFLKLLEQKR
jgi:hypothetical protein